MELPKEPWPPFEPAYEATTKKVYIYSFTERFQEDDFFDEEKPKIKQKNIKEINLQWLLDQIPEGIKPKQIKIEFGFNASSMSYDDHYVSFYYEEKVPARKQEYNLAMKEYKANLAQYEKDLLAYNEWVKAEKIKQLKIQLGELEG